MKNGLLAAIIPFDRHSSPIRFTDGALIIAIAIPANAVPDFEFSGFVARHGFVRSKRSLDKSAEFWSASCFGVKALGARLRYDIFRAFLLRHNRWQGKGKQPAIGKFLSPANPIVS